MLGCYIFTNTSASGLGNFTSLEIVISMQVSAQGLKEKKEFD